jgi:hypothetical protein
MEIAQKKKCLIEGKNVEGFMHNTSMDFSAIFQQY